MFDIIVNPFVTILTLLYGLLGNNTVLAIAFLTVAIRLATSPLMIQQQRSTKAMQEIQPQLTKLREKHKNDREKLSQAQMELYREAGINPLGGCLPLLIQLPILLALYQSILFALAGTPYQLIDLSGRLLLPGLDNLVPLNNHWFGMDLTLAPTANPQYALILPLFVMATTWLQSRLTMPAPKQEEGEEPNQAAAMTRSMTTIMPLMFGFFSLSFSVGLSIYFVVSNLVGIIQYTVMGRADWRSLVGSKSDSQPEVIQGKVTPVRSSGDNGVSSEVNGEEPVKVDKRPSPKAKNKKMRNISKAK
jgi:YidC/Oxa1 family membrane protein insertase